MIKLTLPENHEKLFASWNVTLHKFLIDSGLFDVEFGAVPLPPSGSAGRVTSNWSAFAINGRYIGLDTWDTDSPTDTLFSHEMFHRDGPLAKVEMVLKIQWMPRGTWTAMKRHAIPTTPWTMFPAREFPLESWNWSPNGNKHQGIVSGSPRYGRDSFAQFARSKACGAKLWAPALTRGADRPAWADYIAACKGSLWGISLAGKRGTDAKNRREVEYASCGVPLALNYQPHYPFQFEAGKQYVYLEKPEDLNKLAEIDPAPFAAESRRIWTDHFSPLGSAKTLLDLCRNFMGMRF